MRMFHAVAIAAVLGLFWFAARPLLADDYPSRPITDIVASTPGGGTDIVSRIFGEQLSKQLGQPFVVENLPGAGSLTGTVTAARAAPDGYTLQTGLTASMAVNPSLFADLPYDPVSDFEPAGMFAQFPFVSRGQQQFPGAFGEGTHRARQSEARARSITPRPATAPGSICRWSCSN